MLKMPRYLILPRRLPSELGMETLTTHLPSLAACGMNRQSGRGGMGGLLEVAIIVGGKMESSRAGQLMYGESMCS